VLDAEAQQGLLDRLRRGDRAAFESVARQHTPRPLQLARRLLGWDETEAQDVVQDALVALLMHPAKAANAKNLEAWLVTVTLNLCRSRGRRRAAWLRFLRLSAAPSPVKNEQAADVPMIDAELSQQVRDAVHNLASGDREVIVLHYLEGHDAADIAGLLGIRPNTVEVRLHRARQRLKALLPTVTGAP
jgi:RNA polymerase sigma-70 factor (ECF subfamily)